MTWVKWFAIGRAVLEAAAELLVGQVASFPITWKGTTYTITIKRG